MYIFKFIHQGGRQVVIILPIVIAFSIPFMHICIKDNKPITVQDHIARSI